MYEYLISEMSTRFLHLVKRDKFPAKRLKHPTRSENTPLSECQIWFSERGDRFSKCTDCSSERQRSHSVWQAPHSGSEIFLF